MLGLRARNRSAFHARPGQTCLLQGLPAKAQKTQEILKTDPPVSESCGCVCRITIRK